MLRDVVGEVAARAVLGEEVAGEVDWDDEVREAGGGEVLEHVDAVIVGGGVSVLEARQ